MRVALTIDHLPNQRLPINYQSLISGYIYHTLYSVDSEFSTWLHEQGYTFEGKRFKHFCYSMLEPTRYKVHGRSQEFELVEGPTKLVLSFNIQEAGKKMIKGLFQDNMIQLNSGEHFRFLGIISQVQLLPRPEFKEVMEYRALTPICISVGEEGKKHAQYLDPTDERYATAFASNLANKANAYFEEERYKTEDIYFKLLSENIKSKLWKIKGTEVKGYMFDFEVEAPIELQEVLLYAGAGVLGSSLGMGCLKFNA